MKTTHAEPGCAHPGSFLHTERLNSCLGMLEGQITLAPGSNHVRPTPAFLQAIKHLWDALGAAHCRPQSIEDEEGTAHLDIPESLQPLKYIEGPKEFMANAYKSEMFQTIFRKKHFIFCINGIDDAAGRFFWAIVDVQAGKTPFSKVVLNVDIRIGDPAASVEHLPDSDGRKGVEESILKTLGVLCELLCIKDEEKVHTIKRCSIFLLDTFYRIFEGIYNRIKGNNPS